MEKKYSNSIGVLVPEVMLPPKGTDMMKWAVVACDQFTSQKEYWEEARKIIGDAPSTLDLILPEAYLGSPDEPERIAAIKANMKTYLKKGIFRGDHCLPHPAPPEDPGGRSGGAAPHPGPHRRSRADRH